MGMIDTMSWEWKQGESTYDCNGILYRAYSHGRRHAVNFEPHGGHVCVYTSDVRMDLRKDNGMDCR